MDTVKKIKKLLMQIGFGVEGSTIAAEHLVSNGVILFNECNELDLCKDNAMCCDDNCQECAKRIYKAYCRKYENIN